MKRTDRSCTEIISLVFLLAAAMLMAAGMAGCRSTLKRSEAAPALENLKDETAVAALVNGEPMSPDSPFPTFKKTGQDPCTDDSGRPLILLFSASSCSHCQWVGGVFDLVAGEYAGRGLVTAHHYDVETGDDLLTEAVETQIPESHLAIGKRGDPEGYLPYFNFGCRFDRIGTGYEEQDDLVAEAEEMSRVIEALLP